MAGSYPDVPGYRFAYDIDGSIGVSYSVTGGISTTINSTNLNYLNRDASTPNGPKYTASASFFVVLIFPELRNIKGYFISTQTTSNPSGGRILATSSDTTNGQDGTWTTQANPYQCIGGHGVESSPFSRSNIESVNWTNVKAVRIATYVNIWSIHLYGSIPSTNSPNRLLITDLANAPIAAQLDFGNMPQRNSATKQFKVINNSSSLTANNITLSLGAANDASPSLIGQYQISTDNIAYANALNIGNLAPGASSNPIYLRNKVDSNAQLGPWTARIVAHPVSWS